MSIGKSKWDCLKDDDFESALYRFERTTKRWIDYWWDCLETIYNKVKELAKEYILDPIAKTVRKIPKSYTVEWKDNTEDEDFYSDGEQLLYYFTFFDRITEKKEFDKIGTTTRTARKRLKEEVRYYNKHGFDIGKVEVRLLKNCGEVPAESYESFLRGILTKKFPNTWKKNDRFFGADITTETIQNGINLFENLALTI